MMSYVKWLMAAGALLSQPLLAADSGLTPFKYVVMEQVVIDEAFKDLFDVPPVLEMNGEGTEVLMTAHSDEIIAASKAVHEQLNRCGGFFAFDDYDTAREFLHQGGAQLEADPLNYTIDQGDMVNGLLPQVTESHIRSTIEHLSDYHNRYYRSQTGVEAFEWIKQTWTDLVSSVPTAEVEFFSHNGFDQQSVILTIPGSDMADEVVVLGGHGDSIAGFVRRTARAPGADDNASGIAALTEAIRILADNGVQPRRTIQFMAYAAEEVGLVGSNQIAREYRRIGKDVVGVLQLDMTNFAGSASQINIITDYTDGGQNQFIRDLVDTYLGVNWADTSCGYACSDHASWHRAGFRASFPFEAINGDDNPNIHTRNDTLDQSNGNADHASHFARLAVAFAVELAKAE